MILLLATGSPGLGVIEQDGAEQRFEQRYEGKCWLTPESASSVAADALSSRSSTRAYWSSSASSAVPGIASPSSHRVHACASSRPASVGCGAGVVWGGSRTGLRPGTCEQGIATAPSGLHAPVPPVAAAVRSSPRRAKVKMLSNVGQLSPEQPFSLPSVCHAGTSHATPNKRAIPLSSSGTLPTGLASGAMTARETVDTAGEALRESCKKATVPYWDCQQCSACNSDAKRAHVRAEDRTAATAEDHEPPIKGDSWSYACMQQQRRRREKERDAVRYLRRANLEAELVDKCVCVVCGRDGGGQTLQSRSNSKHRHRNEVDATAAGGRSGSARSPHSGDITQKFRASQLSQLARDGLIKIEEDVGDSSHAKNAVLGAVNAVGKLKVLSTYAKDGQGSEFCQKRATRIAVVNERREVFGMFSQADRETFERGFAAVDLEHTGRLRLDGVRACLDEVGVGGTSAQERQAVSLEISKGMTAPEADVNKIAVDLAPIVRKRLVDIRSAMIRELYVKCRKVAGDDERPSVKVCVAGATNLISQKGIAESVHTDDSASAIEAARAVFADARVEERGDGKGVERHTVTVIYEDGLAFDQFKVLCEHMVERTLRRCRQRERWIQRTEGIDEHTFLENRIELLQMFDLFLQYDDNGNGVLEGHEVLHCLNLFGIVPRTSEFQTRIERLMLNEEGVCFKDFVLIVQKIRALVDQHSDEELKRAFQLFEDIDQASVPLSGVEEVLNNAGISVESREAKKIVGRLLREISVSGRDRLNFMDVKKLAHQVEEQLRRLHRREEQKVARKCGFSNQELVDLRRAFDQFDVDCSGGLDPDEVQRALRVMMTLPLVGTTSESTTEPAADGVSGEKVPRRAVGLSVAESSQNETGADLSTKRAPKKTMQRTQEIHQDALNIAFEQLDVDGSGSLDFCEFLRFVRTVRDCEGVFAEGAVVVTCVGCLSQDDLACVALALGCKSQDSEGSLRSLVLRNLEAMDSVAEVCKHLGVDPLDPLLGKLGVTTLRELLAVARKRHKEAMAAGGWAFEGKKRPKGPTSEGARLSSDAPV